MIEPVKLNEYSTELSEENLISRPSKKIDTYVVFCSYVQNNTKLDRAKIAEFFKTKKATRMIVCQEYTYEEKIHYHALVIKDDRFCIRNMAQFDVNNEHPNIRYAPKSALPFLVDYVLKTDKYAYLYKIDPRDWSKKASSARGITKIMVDNVIEESETAEDAMDTLTENGLAMKEYAAVQKYVKDNFPPVNPAYFSKYKYKADCYTYSPELMKELNKWVFSGVRYDRYPLIVIVGPTKRRKTNAIRALGPHLYFKKKVNMEAFANVPADCKFIVMDDILPEQTNTLFNNNALMLGMEDGWTERFLYIGDKKIENPVPVIWLCNKLPKEISATDDSCGQGIGYYYKNSIVFEVNCFMQNVPHRYIEQKLLDKYKEELKEDKIPHIIHPTLEEIKEKAEGLKDIDNLEEIMEEMASLYSDTGMLKKDKLVSSIVMVPGIRQTVVDNKWIKKLNKKDKK